MRLGLLYFSVLCVLYALSIRVDIFTVMSSRVEEVGLLILSEPAKQEVCCHFSSRNAIFPINPTAGNYSNKG